MRDAILICYADRFDTTGVDVSFDIFSWLRFQHRVFDPNLILSIRYITKDMKLREEHNLCQRLRVTASSRGGSLRFAPYVFLASLHSVCSIPFSFPNALPPPPSPVSPRVFTYVRPIQMAKVNFAITKYLARKSLHAMEPPTILALPPPSTGEKLPLDFHGEKGTPTPCARTHSRPRGAPEGNLFCQPNSRLLLTFAKITQKYARATLKNDQIKFNDSQIDYSHARRPCM